VIPAMPTIDPRIVLERQVKRAEDMGFDIQVGTELEFYLLDPETNKPKDKGIGVYGLDRAAELEHVLGPIRQQINEAGIPIEQSNPEYAAGHQHGYKATFMAKPFFEESGNGFHCHYSIWKNKKNLFAKKGALSQEGQYFVGGLQKRMAEAAVCGSATVNGFRRRQPYTFCPINTTWGIDNRTVGLRIIQGSDNATRVEKRDAGADCNPYLLLATDIAAGLDGIEKKIKPSAITEGNAYEAEDAAPIPTDLTEALKLARGDDMYEIALQQCERELDFFAAQVTDVETARYLDNF